MFGGKSFLTGIRLVPVTSTGVTVKGDLEVLDATGKVNFFNGSSASAMVTEAHAATLTNKTISGSSNTLSNISYASLILTNSIVNADISSSAAIAYSKLNLTNSILNADINSAAAIVYSKLNLSASILNADINVSAAIARTKLASGSNDHVIINNGSGVLSSEATLAKSRGGTAQDNSSLTFPASGTLATLAGIETFSNKSFSDSIVLPEIATPTTPSSGNGKIYFKSDGSLYQLNDAGAESQVAAFAATVAASYLANNDTTVVTGATPTIIQFNSSVFDTNSAVTTGAAWKFTAPTTGKYRISAKITFGGSENWTAASFIRMDLYKNGILFSPFAVHTPETTLTGKRIGGFTSSYLINLTATDYIDLRARHDEAGSRTVTFNGIQLNETWVCIERIQ